MLPSYLHADHDSFHASVRHRSLPRQPERRKTTQLWTVYQAVFEIKHYCNPSDQHKSITAFGQVLYKIPANSQNDRDFTTTVTSSREYMHKIVYEKTIICASRFVDDFVISCGVHLYYIIKSDRCFLEAIPSESSALLGHRTFASSQSKPFARALRDHRWELQPVINIPSPTWLKSHFERWRKKELQRNKEQGKQKRNKEQGRRRQKTSRKRASRNQRGTSSKKGAGEERERNKKARREGNKKGTRKEQVARRQEQEQGTRKEQDRKSRMIPELLFWIFHHLDNLLAPQWLQHPSAVHHWRPSVRCQWPGATLLLRGEPRESNLAVINDLWQWNVILSH